MIDVIVGKHHYQREIKYPVERAQEGFDYYEYEVVASGNIANDLPLDTHNKIAELTKTWTEDKVGTISYSGCKLRLTGDLCYIELLEGDPEDLVDDTTIQEKIKEGQI